MKVVSISQSDGSSLEVAGGKIVLNSAAKIVLDAGGGGWQFKDDDTEIFSLLNIASDMYRDTVSTWPRILSLRGRAQALLLRWSTSGSLLQVVRWSSTRDPPTRSTSA